MGSEYLWAQIWTCYIRYAYKCPRVGISETNGYANLGFRVKIKIEM